MAAYMFFVTLFVLFNFGQSAPQVKDVKLPTYYNRCYQDEPNLDDCLKESTIAFIPYMRNGIKELKVPAIDPMFIEDVLIELKGEILENKMLLKDVYTYGLSDVKVLSLKTDYFSNPNTFTSILHGLVDQTRIEGKYKLEGKFLNTPMTGNGFFNVTMKNVDVVWTVTGSKIQRNGKTYLQVEKFDAEPKIGKFKVYATNLFNGNQQLSKTFLQLVNDFWPVFFQETQPFMRETIDKIMRPLANKSLARIPLEEFIPPSRQ